MEARGVSCSVTDWGAQCPLFYWRQLSNYGLHMKENNPKCLANEFSWVASDATDATHFRTAVQKFVEFQTYFSDYIKKKTLMSRNQTILTELLSSYCYKYCIKYRDCFMYYTTRDCAIDAFLRRWPVSSIKFNLDKRKCVEFYFSVFELFSLQFKV